MMGRLYDPDGWCSLYDPDGWCSLCPSLCSVNFAGTLYCEACWQEMLAPEILMKNGDIRKLPKSNSPLGAQQWAVQGTRVVPYIVSMKKKAGNGTTTGGDQSWSCSCGYGHNPCVHVTVVQDKEGIPKNLSNYQNLNPAMKVDFEKYLASQAAPVVQSGLLANGLKDKGRRFRTE